MKRFLKITTAALILANGIFLAGCEPEVLKELPKTGTLSHKEIVYVENDGRCATDQIIKITGGKMSKNIPRQYECVQRPE